MPIINKNYCNKEFIILKIKILSQEFVKIEHF
jgi:hypothetical protein